MEAFDRIIAKCEIDPGFLADQGQDWVGFAACSYLASVLDICKMFLTIAGEFILMWKT